MPIMLPGYQTGIYYIPVANLPWNCTAEKLRDHAQNRQLDGSGLAILEAHVYSGPKSTSGWVKVCGLEDFQAAVRHLNQSAMEVSGRSARTLLADGRNETSPVMLGESSPASPSPSRQCAQQQTTWQPVPQPANTTLPQDFLPSWALPAAPAVPTPMSPSFSENSYYRTPSPHYNYTQYFNGFAPQNEYRQAIQLGMVLVPLPPMQQPLYMVPVEPHMQAIPQALELQHLEIATHSNGSPKSHAFAVLGSHSTAKCTVDALNGHSWQGRTLHARFAKEGVERHVPRSMVPDLSAQYTNIQTNYRGDQMAPEVSNLSKEGEKEARRKMLSDDARSHTPVVVDGSSCGKKHK